MSQDTFEAPTVPKKDLTWWENVDYELIGTRDAACEFLNATKDQEEWAIDIETTGLNPYQDHVVGISFSNRVGSAKYFSVNHADSENVSLDEIKTELQNFFDRSILILQNGKFDWKFLMRAGFTFEVAHDTMVQYFLTYPNDRRPSLKPMAKKLFQIDMLEFKELFESSKKAKDYNAGDLRSSDIYMYGCSDADITFRVHKKLFSQMVKQENIYNMEMKIVHAVAKMEMRGIILDAEYLAKQSEILEPLIIEAQKDCWRHMGSEVVLGSPKKVADVLFDKEGLNIPVLERTPKGAPSTGKDALEPLEDRFPVVKSLLTWRTLSKLKSSFLDSLEKYVEPETGAIHSDIMACHVPTGRFANAHPNLQQIPKGDPAKTRKCFVARDGYYFIDVDYNQVELRVFASEAQIPEWVKGYNEGSIDIHRQTASIMMSIPYDEVTPEQRSAAKTLNFGLIYGMSPHGLVKQIGVTEERAKSMFRAFFAAIPAAKRYIDKTHQNVKRQGFVTTKFGRIRPLPEVFSDNRKQVAFGLRSSVNTKIQGGAADVMKIAILRVDKTLEPYDAHILLTIHDELIIEVNKKHDPLEMIALIRKAMEFKIPGFCRIQADFEVGPNWYDVKSLEEKNIPDPPPSSPPPIISQETSPPPPSVTETSEKSAPRVEIKVDWELSDKHMDFLEALFKQCPGSSTVYIDMMGEMVELPYKVDPTVEFTGYVRKGLKKVAILLIGADGVEVKERIKSEVKF